MTAYTYRMPSGIPGDLSRQTPRTIENSILNSSLTFPSYGVPGKLASGKFVPIAGGEVASDIRGFLLRPFPTQGVNASDALGTAVPATSGIANILRRGYCFVKNNAGTPASRGQVYVRTANASGGKPIGGIEATQEWGSTSAAKSGGNTGNGTLVLDATTPVQANAVPGVYTVRCIEAVTNGGKFEVKDPTGKSLGMAIIVAGAGGTYTFTDQIKFVLTDAGTDFIVGDGFDVTVVANTLAIPGCYFMDAADSSNNVEIEYNI
jgi:hypothetical protein